MALPRVVLADDTPEMLKEITRLVRGKVDIVGVARNGQEALDRATRTDVDLMILDISMPVMDGIRVAARLRERGRNAKVIFVTVHEDPDYIEAAWSVGALGYVLKSRLATDLMPALQEVLAGKMFSSQGRIRRTPISPSAA
jgi:DNA-binding NarL/FixJ family response regulator